MYDGLRDGMYALVCCCCGLLVLPSTLSSHSLLLLLRCFEWNVRNKPQYAAYNTSIAYDLFTPSVKQVEDTVDFALFYTKLNDRAFVVSWEPDSSRTCPCQKAVEVIEGQRSRVPSIAEWTAEELGGLQQNEVVTAPTAAVCRSRQLRRATTCLTEPHLHPSACIHCGTTACSAQAGCQTYLDPPSLSHHTLVR